jgi:catechol 2,3-dioxygenase-like lactoylglutathione lyase family enzyme
MATSKSTRRAFVALVVAGGAGRVARVEAQAQAPGRIAGFDHVAVPMRSPDAMIAFYRGLGCQIRESTSVVSVYVGQQMINLHRPALWQNATFTLKAPAAAPPCGDFCFVWEGSAPALNALLTSVGAKVEVGPVDRAGGRQKTGSSTYVRDPDGNLLEFIIYA